MELRAQAVKYAKFLVSLDEKTKDLIKNEQALALKNHSDIDFITKVLMTQPEKRKQEELIKFSEQIMGIKFFRERQQLSQDDILELSYCFKFQEISSMRDVINYGDEGDKFYIIIKGIV